MNPRSAPALHLPQSPLILVLAQVRIAPVLSVESKIPAIQEQLRKNGFPRINERELRMEKRHPDGTQEVETKRQWEFIDKDLTRSVLIDQDSLTYQVTHYKLFEQFAEAFGAILDVFSNGMEPTLTQRIGLRYVDLITPAPGKSLERYLSSSLRGFSVQEGDTREGFVSESVSQTGSNTKFIHRYAEAIRGYGFPPDLQPLTLSIPRELRQKSPFGLLDLDHILTAEEDFSTDSIHAHFWHLHDHHTKAFRASVTPDALDEWSLLA